MFDIAPSEFMLVAFVALVVIGPKDLPKAMRLVGYWVGKARGVARQFRSGFDSMVREAELEEMEKRWAQENERIMREHPVTQPDNEPADRPGSEPDSAHDTSTVPVMVEQPVIVAAPEHPPVVAGHGDRSAALAGENAATVTVVGENATTVTVAGDRAGTVAVDKAAS